MKVEYQRVIVIKDGDLKPIRFTDPNKAAEYWARAKEQEWIEKHRAEKKYFFVSLYGRTFQSTLLYGEARIRYRKLKRRALSVFRYNLNK